MKALILLEHDDGTQTTSVVEDCTASIDLDRVHIEGLVRSTLRSRAEDQYVTVLRAEKRPEAAT